MTILYGDNEGIRLRGQLRHSWLRNQILNKDDQAIKDLAALGEWKELFQEFDFRISQLRRLSQIAEESFGPRQLFADDLEGDDPGAEAHRARAKVLHDKYLEMTGIRDIADGINKSADEIDVALNRLKRAWNNNNEGEISKQFQAVLQIAKKLNSLLDTMPRGIVMP